MKQKGIGFMQTYIHKVQYYETDKMGITHHSNYIRWMEEARIDFLDVLGWGYDKLEELGVSSPVIGVECQYKKSTTFGDTIGIEVKVIGYNGVKLTIKYIMINNLTKETCAVGKSEHCFLSKDNKLISLKRELPELDIILCNILSK